MNKRKNKWETEIASKANQHSLCRLNIKSIKMKIRYFIAYYMVKYISFLHNLNQEIDSVIRGQITFQRTIYGDTTTTKYMSIRFPLITESGRP